MCSSRVLLVLLLALALQLSCRSLAAADEEAYADGYEYEYVYEGEEGENGVLSVGVDTSGAATVEAAAEAAAASRAAAGNANAAEARSAAQAVASAKQEEEEQIRRRRMGKRGYKKNVGGSLRSDLQPLRSPRLLDLTELEEACEPLSKWGRRLEAAEPAGGGLPVDKDAARAAEIKKKAVNEASAALDAAAADEAGGGEEGGGGSSGRRASKGRAPKPKKPTFRELQAKKAAEKGARDALRAKKAGGYRVGAACEALVCQACQVVAEEFAGAVLAGGRDEKFPYVEDLLGGFCLRKTIQLRYLPVVTKMCMAVAGDKAGYKDALLVPFEADANAWETATAPETLQPKVRRVCTTVGACSSVDFDMQLAPATKEQEHWDDRCYTCQAFAKNLEARLHVTKGLTEGGAQEMVQRTCGRLDFPVSSFKALCLPLTQSPLVQDISWIAFMHAEAIVKKARVEKLFPDTMCESIGYCTKWVDPDAEAPVQVTEDMFF